MGGFTARMNPDGSMVHIIGHNYRNSYEQTITSFGDVFQNDNDDPPAARTTFVMEYGNAGFSSFDDLDNTVGGRGEVCLKLLGNLMPKQLNPLYLLTNQFSLTML